MPRTGSGVGGLGAPLGAPHAPRRPHPESDRPAPGARRPATHFSPLPHPGLRGPSRTPRRPRGTCGSGIPSSFAGHFREGPAAGGGGGRRPLAPPARRRMPLSAPLFFSAPRRGSVSDGVRPRGVAGRHRRRLDRGTLAPSPLRGRAHCF